MRIARHGHTCMQSYNSTMLDTKLSFPGAGCATSENKATFETHCEATGHSPPSIIAEMLTIAVCTHADRKNVRRWSQFVCDLGFLETEVDGEKICGNIHDCGDVGCGCTGRAWIWSMVTGASVSLGTSRSRKVTIQFAWNVSIENSETPIS